MRPPDQADEVFVVRVEPPDGASGILRDAPVLARVSHRLDTRTLSAESIRIVGPSGPIPMRIELSRDGFVLICRPERPLEAGVEHRVLILGLRDARGREVMPHESRFVPGGLGLHDLVEEAC